MTSSKPHFVPSADPAGIVVPGVDPTLPPAVQIEQIDQLITDRLASIDNNMAKAHQILTTQILPSVQRFAQATQPTRDAARFWKSFFELAAQVRVPTEGDYSQLEPELEASAHETPTEDTDRTSEQMEEPGNETVTEDSSRQQQQQHPETTHLAPSSFLSTPAQSGVEHSFSNVVSSTPARTQHPGQDLSQISIASTDVPAWSPSHVSVFAGPGVPSTASSTAVPSAKPTTKGAATLLGDFTFSSSSESSAFQPPSPSTDGTSQTTLSSFEMGVPLPQRPKGKGKPSDLRQKVLRRNSKGGAGPGTPKLSKYNPFQPQGLEEDGGGVKPWNGLVDLNNTSHSLSSDASSVIPDFAKINFSSSSADSAHRDPNVNKLGNLQPPTAQQLWSDTSSNASSVLRFPPQNKDLVRIAATPSKKAADLLVKDLLAGFDFEDSPGPREVVPTPPRPTFASRPRQSYRSAGRPRPSVIQAFKSGRLKDDDGFGGGGGGGTYYDGDEDDSDSFEDEGAEGVYDAQGSHEPYAEEEEYEDSFDSSFGDDDGGGGGQASVEGGGNDFTDFTDFGGGGGDSGGRVANDETDTLFGPRGNPPPPQAGFRLEGPHTTRIQMQLGHPEAMMSPTPFSGDYVDLDRRGR